MTVATTTNKQNYTGNGVTTLFGFTVPFIAASDLQVYINGVLKTLTTDYSISGSAPYPAGANVTFTTAPANGALILIVRTRPFTQTLDLVANDPLPADQVELLLGDHMVMLLQQLNEVNSRSFSLAITDTSGASTVVPTPVGNKALLWNPAGTALINSTDNFNDIVTNANAAATSAGNAATTATNASNAAVAAAATVTGIAASVRYIWGGTNTGTGDAILLTNAAYTSPYQAGDKIRFLMNGLGNSAAAPTFNVNSFGNVTVKKTIGNALVGLAPNDILANTIVEVEMVDASNAQLLTVQPFSYGADIASAATLNLNIRTGYFSRLTGSTVPTTVQLAQGRMCRLQVVAGMTFNALASLLLPAGASTFTVAANGYVDFMGGPSGVVQMFSVNVATTADNVVTKSATGSIAVGEDYVLGNAAGGAITFTLPAASNGRKVYVQKSDSTLTQITVVPATGTINGKASIKISTQYEGVLFESDGTNWFIGNRRIVSEWVPYTPVPVGFGTVTVTNMMSRRNGDTLQVRGNFVAGTGTAVEARMSLGYNGVNAPAGLTSDTTKVPNLQIAGLSNNTSVGTTVFGANVLIESGVAYVTFARISSTTNGTTKVSGSNFVNSGDTVQVTADIPIQGWEG